VTYKAVHNSHGRELASTLFSDARTDRSSRLRRPPPKCPFPAQRRLGQHKSLFSLFYSLILSRRAHSLTPVVVDGSLRLSTAGLAHDQSSDSVRNRCCISRPRLSYRAVSVNSCVRLSELAHLHDVPPTCLLFSQQDEGCCCGRSNVLFFFVLVLLRF
jgi:hypothetical protein